MSEKELLRVFKSKWHSMKSRCKKHKNYAGRGIKVCERWMDFNNYHDDMYDSFCESVKDNGLKDTTIERINVDGDYEPSNCKWATQREQAQNKTNSHQIKYEIMNKLYKEENEPELEEGIILHNTATLAEFLGVSRQYIDRMTRKNLLLEPRWRLDKSPIWSPYQAEVMKIAFKGE